MEPLEEMSVKDWQIEGEGRRDEMGLIYGMSAQCWLKLTLSLMRKSLELAALIGGIG